MWKEVFDERFKSLFKERVILIAVRMIRIFLILGIAIQFFIVAFIPSPSMYPTLQTKDVVLVDATVKVSEYKRGDIVAFESPLLEDNGKVYIKRVIGLPNEEVEIKDNKVYINGEPLYEEYLAEAPYYDYPKTEIPEGHYFMLGDNRNVSYDSSRWGFVPKENFKGRVVWIIFPFNRLQKVNNDYFE